MSEPLRGVVACHGQLARALVDAAEQISGVKGALIPVSNSECDRGLIQERVAGALGEGPALLFVDLPSGSCFIAAATQARQRPDVAVVSGVNLPMLLDFLFHRTLSLEEAAARAVTAGGQAIRRPG
jgi:mannose/fructose-specific phosphotransferase system component IIA